MAVLGQIVTAKGAQTLHALLVLNSVKRGSRTAKIRVACDTLYALHNFVFVQHDATVHKHLPCLACNNGLRAPFSSILM